MKYLTNNSIKPLYNILTMKMSQIPTSKHTSAINISTLSSHKFTVTRVHIAHKHDNYDNTHIHTHTEPAWVRYHHVCVFLCVNLFDIITHPYNNRFFVALCFDFGSCMLGFCFKFITWPCNLLVLFSCGVRVRLRHCRYSLDFYPLHTKYIDIYLTWVLIPQRRQFMFH